MPLGCLHLSTLNLIFRYCIINASVLNMIFEAEEALLSDLVFFNFCLMLLKHLFGLAEKLKSFDKAQGLLFPLSEISCAF